MESLTVNVHDAARMLGICERKLAALTKEEVIRCLRMGRRVVYSVEYLREWVRNGGQEGMGGNGKHSQ